MNHPPARLALRFSYGVTRSAVVGALLLGPLGPSNCTVWVNEFTDQCTNDEDCVNKGEAFLASTCDEGVCRRGPAPAVDPKWACVGQVDLPAPTRSSVTVNFTLSLLGPNLPVEGSSIRACFRNDDACAVAAAGPVTTNGNGQASIDVPTSLTTPGSLGFNGYFEIVGSKHSPYLYVPTPPIVDNRDAVLLVSTLDGFARVLKATVPDLTLDPGRAVLSLQSRDCEQNVTAGARFQTLEADAQTRGFYLLNGSFTPAASATDATGISIVTNVPTTTGQATVVGTSDGVDGRTLSLALPIRAGHITFTEAPPTP